MKITVFIGTLQGGGAERIAVTLANAFAEKGHTVDLVLIRAEGVYLEQGLVSPKIRIVDLKLGRTRYALWPWMQYLKQARPDAILSLLTDINMIAILGKHLAARHAKLIISERTTISLARKKHATPTFLVRLILCLMYRLADDIICVSKQAATDLKTFAMLRGKAVTVIYNPIDLDQITLKAQQPLEHPWLLQPDQPPVILAAGRLEPVKNFALLLTAFAQVKKQLNCRLILLGEGSLRHGLQQLANQLGISEDIDMPGFSNNPYAYMARSAAFVLSSNHEGLPSALIEALACGCPVVSTRCPSGPAEILEDGNYGMLVPVGDVSALAEAIRNTLQGINVATKEKRLHRAHFFSKERAINDYIKILTA